MFMGNPAGLYALLGIPVVVGIHFLQRRARMVTVSTLFLLEKLQRESAGGNRFERLRSSIPLWLQLAVVLVVTWLLIEPRWQREDMVQRLAIVMDGSASMLVAKPGALSEVRRVCEELAKPTSRTEYYLINSRDDAGYLYHGVRLEEMVTAVSRWEPRGGTHDLEPALRVARSLVGVEGNVVLVTDRGQKDMPHGAKVLACGESVANCGVSGVRVSHEDGKHWWQATVRNYSAGPQQRAWFLKIGDTATAEQVVELPAHGAVGLRGEFPSGTDLVTLHLTPDVFALDDRAAMLIPRSVSLRVRLPLEPDGVPIDRSPVGRLFTALGGVSIVTEAPHLEAVYYDPLNPSLPSAHACVFVRDPRDQAPALTGKLLVERHPFTKDVDWQSLLVQDVASIPAAPQDEVLVWCGERPLVFLRGVGLERALCFNFDLRKSNAPRLPAFIMAVHRFLEGVRRTTVGEVHSNVECGQRLSVAADRKKGAEELVTYFINAATGEAWEKRYSVGLSELLRAPDEAGVFTVKQGGVLCLRAAVHFADAREADFSQAQRVDETVGLAAVLLKKYSNDDANWRLALLALGGLVGGAWHFSRRGAM